MTINKIVHVFLAMQNCSAPRKTAASNDPTKPVFSSQKELQSNMDHKVIESDWSPFQIRWQCLKPLSLWPVRVSSRGLAEAGECFLQKHPTKASTQLQQPQESLYIQLSENLILIYEYIIMLYYTYTYAYVISMIWVSSLLQILHVSLSK